MFFFLPSCVYCCCLSVFFLFFFRWLDRNEDDGQIVRELVPAGDGLRLFSEYITIKAIQKNDQ